LCLSPLEMTADLGRVAVPPRAFNKGRAGMTIVRTWMLPGMPVLNRSFLRLR